MRKEIKKIKKDYLENKIKLEKYQSLGILCLLIVLTGMTGWLYEYIFYFFDKGMKYFYWQGGNFLPWINIYAIGSIMILLITKKVKKNPLLVFIISVISTGILEFIVGYAIYTLQDGLRYWDYNTEILNFGNIGGFVCLRSVLIFGLGGLLLIYYMVPILIYISKKMNKKSFLILSISLCSIFLFDEIYNLVLTKIFHTPKASYFYKKLGIKYMTYKRG